MQSARENEERKKSGAQPIGLLSCVQMAVQFFYGENPKRDGPNQNGSMSQFANLALQRFQDGKREASPFGGSLCDFFAVLRVDGFKLRRTCNG